MFLSACTCDNSVCSGVSFPHLFSQRSSIVTRIFFLALVCGVFGQLLVPTVPGDPVRYPDDYCEKIRNGETFDFIVVGAGPAGSAVSRRLAELPDLRILLIEAGSDPTPMSDIPGNIETLEDGRWNFSTVSSRDSCQATKNKACGYAPGKVLGGSSVVNYMSYGRGNHRDFDEWVAMGGTGWNYEDVLPYFKKLENHLAQTISDTVSNTSVSSVYHRRGGPLTSDFFPLDQKTHPIREAIFQAAADNGFDYNPDVNGADQIGITNTVGMVDSTGYRQNTAKVYLQNPPDNLKICKNGVVTKVLFQLTVAVGVQFSLREDVLNVYATREVILSAGPFNSPVILERSGIGQSAVLKKAGVRLLVERPGVGENLQDQFTNYGNAFTVDLLTAAAENPMSIGLLSVVAFRNLSDPSYPAPDVQMNIRTYKPTMATRLQWSSAIADQFNNQSDVLFFGFIVLRQGRTGSIHIQDRDGPPRIVTNQLATVSDLRTTIAATRLARKIMSHEALRPFTPKPFVLRECSKYPFDSDLEIICAARYLANTLHHVVGACRMGHPLDPMSVVDSRLRVIGVQRLRVVDSSIMPRVTRANTEIPTVMIGEKGADIIKEDHHLSLSVVKPGL